MTRWRFAVVAVGSLAACRSPEPGPWHEEAGYRWRDLAPPVGGSAGFTSQRPGATGVAFRNDVAEAKAFANRHLVQGSGVAIADVDGDGRADVYLTRTDGANALYRNLGRWKFENMAAAAGVELADRASTGAVFADVDGDGDQDLIVTAMAGRNSLFLNDGRGRFTDATAESGFVPESRGSTTATLADVDGDGDLDLYVANYKATTMLDSLSPQERAFDQLVKRIEGRYEIVPSRRDNYRVVLRDDIRAVSVVQRADPDWFYLNDGAGHFTREMVAGNPRFLGEDGGPLDREPDDFGLAARFFDANGDGAPDLYVANDFEDPDQFWINDGTGRFRLIDRTAVRQTSNSGMAVDVADVDRDGDMDLFEVDMLANDSHRRKTQTPTHTPIPKVGGDYRERGQWQRNALLANRGDGTFAEVGAMAGVAASGWSWSALFLDVDLDGYEDILIGNGHRWDLMDTDVQERLKSLMTGVDWREERKFYPTLALKNVAFRNLGGLRFEEAGSAWRFGTEEDISHGMAAGDLDGDGDLDVVVNRLDAPALLLRNDAPAGRLLVRLAGRAPNVDGVGAVIQLRGRGRVDQSKEMAAGGLYLSGSEPAAAFAAQGDSLVLEVQWRSGAVSTVVGAVAGREYRIAEPPGGPVAGAASPEGGLPLFEDVSDRLRHRQVETEFGDFARQPLLPIQLSQLGPGVSWIDLDGDDDDDLVIGAGAGGRLAAFRNTAGRFSPLPGFAADSFDLTQIVAGPGVGVLVGQSSYQAASPASALGAAQVFRWAPGRQPEVAVPGDTTSAGPLALGDIDGDGDLDLFVGGRVAPGVYPLAGNSRVWRNEGGRFVVDESNRAALRSIGMVSSAVFSDLDADGDPDLVLALEWGPIKVLENQGGRFADRTEAWKLDRLSGRWNGIATGDFDGDGRIDLVATNWGRNTMARPDSARPLYLYYGGWGGDGVSMSLAQVDPRLKGLAPLLTLSRLTAALPEQRRRTPTFAAYADATLEQAFGDALGRGGRLVATTYDQMVFLNRGGFFEPRSLPLEAQQAPAFGVAVADFDGDGAEDLFLAQNFSETDIASPRLDAGRGLVLLGDGRGGFAALSGNQSGVRLAADQRGVAVADFDDDGRPDVVVGQNMAATVLFRNATGRPGLRVRLAGGLRPAVLRLGYPDGLGPAREVRLGGGYWSQDGAPVLGTRPDPVALWVRWTATDSTRVPLRPGQRAVTVFKALPESR